MSVLVHRRCLCLPRLSKDEQKLIKQAVETATDYWSKAIRPKYQLNDRIRLNR